jgi:ubiquinone/menaquinone biosynthesis C-methylase UbiE
VLNPALESQARKLWTAVAEELSSGPAAQHDRQRLARVREQRRAKSREFFSSAARWDAMRSETFGTNADLIALLALLDDSWAVGDLGCGTGRISQLLAPCVSRVIAVDASEEMLRAARERLSEADNVDVRQGELESLPLDTGSLDAAVLSLVLHHTADPAVVIAEAARVLRPGGRLLVVDMLSHDREEYRQQMGHVWLGFSEEQLSRWLTAAGFARFRVRLLPADVVAKGPLLLSASARKGTDSADPGKERVPTAGGGGPPLPTTPTTRRDQAA